MRTKELHTNNEKYQGIIRIITETIRTFGAYMSRTWVSHLLANKGR